MRNNLGVKTALYLLCLVMIEGFAATSFAECPKGKVAVTVTTPSGKQKTLCVSENAVSGIENAAEHSGSTIVPSTCPCWTQSELKLVAERNTDFVCIKDPIAECLPGKWAPHYTCGIKDGDLFYLGRICGEIPLMCLNYYSIPEVSKEITQEEYDACLAMFNGYLLPSKE